MEIKINRPFDGHVHLRKDKLLQDLISHYNILEYAIIMGNTIPPVRTKDDAQHYLLEANCESPKFIPKPAIMFTTETSPQIIIDAFRAGFYIFKLIPGGTSTGSEHGVRLADLLLKYNEELFLMGELGMTLSIHLELLNDPRTGKEIRKLDREGRAIPYLEELMKRFPKLRIVVEHASTRKLIELIKEAPTNVAATLTAHHALIEYSQAFNRKGEITDPDLFCYPCVKTEPDRQAVMDAMLSGNQKFFYGSDSAPHPKWDKRGRKPKAGIFTPPTIGIPLLGQIFKDSGISTKRLNDFVSNFGRAYYGFPPASETITLVEEQWMVPREICGVVPFMAGKVLDLKIKEA